MRTFLCGIVDAARYGVVLGLILLNLGFLPILGTQRSALALLGTPSAPVACAATYMIKGGITCTSNKGATYSTACDWACWFCGCGYPACAGTDLASGAGCMGTSGCQ